MKTKKTIKIGNEKKLSFGFHAYRVNEKTKVVKDEESFLPKQDNDGVLNKFIHIGYPKSGSTVLQNGFFGKHPEILNLGCGNRSDQTYWDDLGYISREINIAMEVDLRYRNSISYNAKKVRSNFESYFEQAKNSNIIRTVGISNENYSFQWNYGIDIEEKAKRLKGIFGRDTKILVVLREQIDLIASLYKEQIRFGYSGSINDFFNYLWDYQDRSALHEFCFDKVIDVYASYFGKENIHIVPFESFKKDNEVFLNNIARVLDVETDLITKIETIYNRQLSDQALEVKKMMNERYSHSFGNGFYQVFDNHRYVPYFTEELGKEVPLEVHLDYQVRHHLVKAAEKIASLSNVEKIDLNIDSNNLKRFSKLFSESNNKLEKAYKLDLKQYKYLS
ncbi:MAG: sulfotransferase domain-containing protein [Nonlabens sp.]